MNLALFPVLVLAIAPAAFAIPVTVTTSVGTQYTTAALTAYTTTNLDMVGSVVTVSFAGGGSSTAIWTASGAVGTGFSLTESGDTYYDAWTLSDTGAAAITGFIFDGAPGNTTFDIIADPVIDTPGSSYGLPFSTVTSTGSVTSVDVLYTNELLVGGHFYGDEYTEEVVTFADQLTTGNSISYHNDTDQAVESSPIRLAATPEPSSLLLLGTGALGAVGIVRRRLAVA